MKITYDEWTEVLHAWHLACDEVEQLREAAREYRGLLYGIESAGSFTAADVARLNRADDRHLALIIDDEEKEGDY